MFPQLTLRFALVRKPPDVSPELIVNFGSYIGVLRGQIQHLDVLFGLCGILKMLSQYLELGNFVHKSVLLASLENIVVSS